MRLILWVSLLLGCQGAWAESDFYLHDGDTVVFYGDSITHQRLYTAFVETYVLTRFPHLRVNFVSSGFSGDRVTGGFGGTIDERLAHDVFPYHPTVVTVLLGMNDGEYRPYDDAIFKTYGDGYRHLVKTLKTKLPDARLTLLEPSPFDDVTRAAQFPGGYNGVLLRFGEFVRKLAGTESATAADLNSPVVAMLQAAKHVSLEAAQDLIPDRVHPSPGVHMIMAEALLKAWHAPSVVTRMEIDASAGTVRKAENTVADALEAHDGLSWTQTDGALPMPLDPPDTSIPLAVRCSDFTEALNQEILKVSGIADGMYRLFIDDKEIGSFDSGQLAAGINLASRSTPMSSQAQEVLDLTHRHNHLHYARWRLVDEALTPYGLADTQATLEALDKLEAEAVALQRAMAMPRPHRYRLTKQ